MSKLLDSVMDFLRKDTNLTKPVPPPQPDVPSVGGGSSTPSFDPSPIYQRLVTLETLLAGIKRVTASDGTVGIYIPFRVGIQTEFFLHQPKGSGVGLSVTTGVDPVAMYVQHDGSDIPVGEKVIVDRIALRVRNTDPNATGTNIGIDSIASNAPHGNIAVDARAQYSPDADQKVTIIRQTEYVNE